ncbi:hypothetical protein GGX14DRAFT_389730 [Mycena pura]|uniref:Uncharacterized protein n=1 Tax=Mycena pura TaxID=153505 RepID=A0AAD6YI69_9AGAR|nr:hypothetical protein GGX14DRAFT_389730 [Mycena pura]
MHRPRNNVIATHPAARLRAACPAARPASRRPTCGARRLTDAANGGRHWAVTRRASGWRAAGGGRWARRRATAAGGGRTGGQRAVGGGRVGGQRAAGGGRAGGMGDGRGSASGGRRAGNRRRAAGGQRAAGGGAQAGNGRRAAARRRATGGGGGCKRRKRRAADATGGGIGGGSNAGKVSFPPPSTFAHLPSGAILVHISNNVILNKHVAEVSKKVFNTFKDLVSEKAGVIRMVTVLTMVQRKGSANTNVLEVEEEDGVDD